MDFPDVIEFFFRRLSLSDFQVITRRIGGRGEVISTESFVKELAAITTEGFAENASDMAVRLATNLVLAMAVEPKGSKECDWLWQAFQEGDLIFAADGQRVMVIKTAWEDQPEEVIWKAEIPPLLQREMRNN